MNTVSFTKEQQVKMYARVNEASIPIVFTFLQNGAAYDISAKNFKMALKKTAQSEDDVFLLEEGSGLEVIGAGNNQLQVELTADHASVRPSTYFYKIFSETEDNTWFADDFYFFVGKSPAPNSTSETITVNDGVSEVTVTISIGGANLDTRTRLTTSTATLTPNIDSFDLDVITAQEEALVIANPIGTAVEGNGFMIRIKATGAYAITFDTDYSGAYGQGLPTVTLANKTLYIIVVRNSVDGTYDVLNYIEEV